MTAPAAAPPAAPMTVDFVFSEDQNDNTKGQYVGNAVYLNDRSRLVIQIAIKIEITRHETLLPFHQVFNEYNGHSVSGFFYYDTGQTSLVWRRPLTLTGDHFISEKVVIDVLHDGCEVFESIRKQYNVEAHRPKSRQKSLVGLTPRGRVN